MREIETGAATTARDAVMSSAIDALREAPGLLLLGPSGVGRSYVLERLVEHGLAAGARVLRCAPVEAELPLPFMCLIDLLDTVSDEALEQLPSGQRDALRAALLRGDGPEAETGGARVPLAVLTLLRRLAAAGPLWLVVDDLQWVDEPTARVLGFVARRTSGTALRFLATEPVPPDRAPAFAGLCPPGTVRLTVPPMTPVELAALLARHARGPLPPATVREIGRAAQGNPRYALELLRALPPGGQPQAAAFDGAVPGPLRTLLLERLHTLPEEVREALVLASAAARPDVTLLATAGGPSVTLHLETAERLGVVRIAPDGHVHFDNPLLRTAVYAEAGGRSRRAAHARLAAAATEPVERARHLALANPARDEDVARTLMVAAASARRRGAPATAAELSALAVARTPAEAEAARTERRLAAAGYAVDAGRWDTARAEARTLLTEEQCPEVRVRARIVLLRCAGNALENEGRLIRDGLADAAAAGSPGLEAQLRCWDSTRDLLAGRIDRATAEARRAADLAERAGEPETLLEALTSLAYLQRLGGDPEAETTLSRALAGARRHGIDDLRLWESLMTEAIFHLHANRLADAESAMLEVLRRFGDQVSVEELMDIQIHVADVRIRSGDCQGALRAARHAAALHADLVGSDGGDRTDGDGGGEDGAGPVAYVTAAAESVGGSLDRARRVAQRGARKAERDGDRFWRLWNLTVLGRVHLISDEPAQAAAVLREVRCIERSMGIVDPGIGRWHADLAEALVGEGTEESLSDARQFIAEVAAVSRRLGRSAVLGSLERAEALLRLSRGEVTEAAGLLDSAIARLRPEHVPLELARALAARAEVERRRRRQAAARRAAEEAVRICRDAGAAAWLEPIERRAHGAARLAPVRQRAAHVPGSSSLTPSEQRIAALAADGATNREIAAACFLSVKTVEASLSRVYRKLGVRSRTELAKTLSG